MPWCKLALVIFWFSVGVIKVKYDCHCSLQGHVGRRDQSATWSC